MSFFSFWWIGVLNFEETMNKPITISSAMTMVIMMSRNNNEIKSEMNRYE